MKLYSAALFPAKAYFQQICLNNAFEVWSQKTNGQLNKLCRVENNQWLHRQEKGTRTTFLLTSKFFKEINECSQHYFCLHFRHTLDTLHTTMLFCEFIFSWVFQKLFIFLLKTQIGNYEWLGRNQDAPYHGLQKGHSLEVIKYVEQCEDNHPTMFYASTLYLQIIRL